MPVTDDFTAADGTALPTYSANWVGTRFDYDNHMQIQSNAVCAWHTGVTVIFERAEAFSADHWAQITFVAISALGDFFGVSVRDQGPASDDGYGFYSNADNANVIEVDAAVPSLLGSGGAGFAVGGIMRLEVVGTTLTPVKNGVTLNPPGAQTDATHAGGKPGLLGANSSGSTGNTRGDSFECTNSNNTVNVVLLGV